MWIAVSIVIGFVTGFAVCWIWKSTVEKRLQSDINAMKASASKGINRL